jgi:hypothetical protein
VLAGYLGRNLTTYVDNPTAIWTAGAGGAGGSFTLDVTLRFPPECAVRAVRNHHAYMPPQLYQFCQLSYISVRQTFPRLRRRSVGAAAGEGEAAGRAMQPSILCPIRDDSYARALP